MAYANKPKKGGLREKAHDYFKKKERKAKVNQAKKKEQKAMNKFDYVMREFNKGKLDQGKTGKKVPQDRPDIAKAIAYSESKKKKNK